MEWKTILKDDFSSLHVENIVELIEELNDYVKDLKKRDGIKWSIEQLMEIEEFLRKAEDILDKPKLTVSMEYRHKEPFKKSPNRKHYTKDGKEWKGKTHKMPNGNLMTEDPHNEKSVRLYHKDELPRKGTNNAFLGRD